ncbi:hypothetical protein [Streptosporangium sandarakinum]|uniref:hypothetical protein n=1 Tax=Streptosporangium sandarakinum TaxID=1260955 RepID=UPI003427E0EC
MSGSIDIAYMAAGTSNPLDSRPFAEALGPRDVRYGGRKIDVPDLESKCHRIEIDSTPGTSRVGVTIANTSNAAVSVFDGDTCGGTRLGDLAPGETRFIAYTGATFSLYVSGL